MSLSKDEILNAIAEMNVMEVVDLVGAMEEKFGVSAAAVAQPVAAAADSGGGAQEEEKTEVNLMLAAVGGKKVSVIKAVRTLTGLGLKDAKDLVDGAPCVIKEAMQVAEAEKAKKELEEAGATVELK